MGAFPDCRRLRIIAHGDLVPMNGSLLLNWQEANMKTILLLVHDDEGQDARLEAALGIARALGGHLACIDVTPSTVVAGDFYVGLGEATLIAEARDSEAMNKAAVTDRLAREDVVWSWSDATGDIATCVLDAARLADLIILSRELDDHRVPDMRAIATRILGQSHVPLVATPSALDRFEFDRALVAWDGGNSSASALRASVPLLALAREVRIFTACDGDGGADPAEAVQYLSRYGIDAQPHLTARAGRRPDICIALECEQWSADYVVMGAYGRGAWREAFGSVTRRMLARSPVPLVLCR